MVSVTARSERNLITLLANFLLRTYEREKKDLRFQFQASKSRPYFCVCFAPGNFLRLCYIDIESGGWRMEYGE